MNVSNIKEIRAALKASGTLRRHASVRNFWRNQLRRRRRMFGKNAPEVKSAESLVAHSTMAIRADMRDAGILA